MSLSEKAKPLGIVQVSAKTVPVDQTGAEQRHPLRYLPQANESSAAAHRCILDHLQEVMLAGEIDDRFGSPKRRVKLAPGIVHERCAIQSRGEAVGMWDPLAEGERSFHHVRGAVGEPEQPKDPCRIHPALHAGTLRVEQNVGTIFPGRDRIVDLDALIQHCGRIGESAEEEQACAQRASGQGSVEWYLLRIRERDQPLA